MHWKSRSWNWIICSCRSEPHFYLNALNLINTMAQAEDVELIGELTENLSLYLRYIVSSRNGKTTVLEESRHIAHYLKIMEIRFGESFRYIQEIDERAEQIVIPPLAVQMLIENSMKYAFDIYGETEIRLKIFMEGSRICISLRKIMEKGIRKRSRRILLMKFRHRTAISDSGISKKDWNRCIRGR